MFTGLVEGLGTLVRRAADSAGGERLSIQPEGPLANETPALGDSICINGCCLTVVALGSSVDTDASTTRRATWEFQAGPETLSRTNLGATHPGDVVNLERSLPVNGRLGGHFVQGHVDGTGRVAEILPHGDWVDLWFSAPAELLRLMVPKGSVAVDGVSLTVVHVTDDRFSVALIPHTLAVTTLGRRQVGDAVNLETDILGKYVAKLLGGPATFPTH
jgi:riboflavin synthase